MIKLVKREHLEAVIKVRSQEVLACAMPKADSVEALFYVAKITSS